MGLSVRETRDLTLWEYEALLVNWNRAHDPDGDVPKYTTADLLAAERFFAHNPQFLN